MKNAVLEELAKRWEYDARENRTSAYPSGEEGKVMAAKDSMYRECKRECADMLRALIQLMPD